MYTHKYNKIMENYGIFLMAMLSQEMGLIEKELEYDIHWEKATGYYNKFIDSPFNTDNKSEYDCIVDFIKNQKKKEKKVNQYYLVQEINNETDINIVTCGSCELVMLHKMNVQEIECPDCGFKSTDHCDFPDYIVQ